MTQAKELGRGAEAVLTLEREGKLTFVKKDRVEKDYRHPEIDSQLRTSRTKREVKILEKAAKAGINVPKVLFSDKQSIIKMEYLEGPAVKEVLDENQDLAITIGKIVAKLHSLDIIHSDLTTSNMILRKILKKGESSIKPEVYLIDFGLSFTSKKLEDKAVDIHLFKQALESKHYENYKVLFELFLKGYLDFEDSDKVIERLVSVEKRGKNKAKF